MKNHPTQRLSVLALVLSVLTSWAVLPDILWKATPQAAPASPSFSSTSPLPLQQVFQTAHIGPYDKQVLPAAYTGAAELQRALKQDSARALTLATFDFDEDGVPDLVGGYSVAEGGLLSFQRGNVDALFPNSVEAQRRKASGRFTDAAFLASAQVIPLPESPEFAATGDFNADGHLDIVTAARGGQALHLLAGDGRGKFGAPEAIRLPGNLPGRVTALASGEINRADGLMDLAVAISRSVGPQVLVFESPDGALRGSPESFDLPEEATALAIGRLDADAMNDLAVAAGHSLLTIKGRDRRLSLDDEGRKEAAPAIISRRSFAEVIADVATGDFNGDQQPHIALLFADGIVRMLDANSANLARAAQSELGRWPDREVFRIAPLRGAAASSRLLCARLSTQPGQNLAIMDSANSSLQVINGQKAARFDFESQPVAALPMQLNTDAISDLVVLQRGRTTPQILLSAPSAIFTVTNAGDSSAGSLRDAINQANATPGADTINFAISSGLQTITPLSPLPVITEAVTIDGTTQPGFAGVPLIELRGTSAGPNTRGLEIGAANCTIKGLVINGFGKSGVFIGGAGASGNQVQGCYIGINAAGTASISNGTNPNTFDTDGIDIFNGAHGNIIGGTTASARNVVSGNTANGADGILIAFAGTNNNLVQGNFLGLDATGTFAIANNFAGVELATIGGPGPQGNTIGGTTAGAGNVASGNGTIGVGIFNADTNNNLVQGNFLGTNAAGTGAVPNTLHGIAIANPPGGPTSAKNNLIGGTVPSARNLISGNSFDGVFIAHDGTNNNLLQGNFIGTNLAGSAALPNVGRGIEIAFGAQQNTVGGTAPGARNVLSGNNNDGIGIFNAGTTGNFVQGNYIGTNAAGTAAVSNGTVNGFHGVEIAFGTSGNTVGGAAAGAGNLISGNLGAGVGVFNPGTTRNIVQGNLIGTDVTGLAPMPAGKQTLVSSVATPNAGLLRSKFAGQATGANPIATGNRLALPSAPAAPIGNSFGLIAIFDSQNTAIGGIAGAGNTIAFNSGAGVLIDSSAGNSIRGNSIFSNGGLGIDLGNGLGFNGENGITPNDSCDGDAGANQQQNFPVLTAASSLPSSVTIQGTLNSTPNSTFVIEFFANPTCDFSGNGEGQVFLASRSVATDGSCNANFNFTFPASVPAGQFITATATDAAGNTSEFSACRQVAQSCFFSITPTNQTFPAAGGAEMVAVTAPNGCNWTAVSNDPGIITINSGTPGSGNGTVSYTVAANASANPRMATMTVAGQTFTVIQNGVTCAGLISPTAGSYSAIGGSGSVTVPAPDGCSWTAASNAAWITVTSGSPGSGNGTVGYSVAVNPGGTRIGTITIAGQFFTVTQTGGLMFYPLPSPVRLLETRAGFSGCTTPNAAINANDTFTLPARTACSGVPSNAAAVVGNITVVPSGAGYLTLYPGNATQPIVANSNFKVGEITNNLFTVGLGPADGTFKIFASATTEVIIDLTGYYATPDPSGLYFHPLPTPVRLVETRANPPSLTGCIKTNAPLSGDFTVQGRSPIAAPCNLIPESAQVLVGNATTVLPNSGGYLTIYPSGADQPLAASSNFAGNDVINGPFAVKLGADGKFNVAIRLFGATDLVIDILGYYSAEAADTNGQGLFFTPLASPARLLETRPDFPGLALPGCFRTNAPLGSGQTYTQAGRGTCTVPVAARALVGNATVVNPIAGGFLTFSPSDAPAQPTVATSNFPFPVTFGYNRHYIVGLGTVDGAFKIFAQFQTDLIVDISGYFAP